MSQVLDHFLNQIYQVNQLKSDSKNAPKPATCSLKTSNFSISKLKGQHSSPYERTSVSGGARTGSNDTYPIIGIPTATASSYRPPQVVKPTAVLFTHTPMHPCERAPASVHTRPFESTNLQKNGNTDFEVMPCGQN